MVRQLVYETDALDAITRLPVVVIDSTAMCSGDGGRAQLPDPERDIPGLLSRFPASRPFVVVFFASQAPKSPQMNWLRKVHGLLPREFKKQIQKVYVVHAKWYTRALNRTLTPLVSPKFASKLVFVKNLTELSHCMDITAMDINPEVYCDDLERTDSTEYGLIPVPKRTVSVFGMPIKSTPTSYWKAALQFLRTIDIDLDVFAPLTRMPEDDARLVHILRHAVAREQRLRLFDYGPTAVLAVLKEYLLSLPEPLVDIRLLPMPMHDTSNYVTSVITKLPHSHFMHLDDLLTFCTDLPEHIDQRVVAQSLGPAVMGLGNPRNDTFKISVRFFRNLADKWQYLDRDDPELGEVANCTRQPTVENDHSQRPPPPPRNQLKVAENEILPRDLPSKIVEPGEYRIRFPSRRAFGKVAEIVRIYDENQRPR